MSPKVGKSGGPVRRTPRGAAEQQVLIAVEELLGEGEAFTTLPVGRIAARAGVARSSFYFHFPDKRTLLLQLAASVTGSLFDPAEAWVRDPDHDVDGLIETMSEVIGVYRRHGALLGAFTEVAAYDEEFSAYWRERVGEFIGAVRRRMERDRRSGALPRSLETGAAAAYLVWGAERTLAQHVAVDAAGTGDRRLATGIAQSMWAVMGPRSS